MEQNTQQKYDLICFTDLAYEFDFSDKKETDFVKPVGWWPPLVETCHCMQFSGFATRALSEQGSWFSSCF